MYDTAQEIAAISRTVAQRSTEEGPAIIVRVSRELTGSVEQVWGALTDPDRVRHWFLPVTGDLRQGGTYRLEGNASGEILTCAAPEHLVLTFGGATSIVDLRLSALKKKRTRLEFDHSVTVEMAGSTAGVLYVGPGWDSALLALGQYLDGRDLGDPVDAASSPEGQAFGAASIEAWATVIEASGTTDANAVSTARRNAMAQFAPDLAPRH